MRRLWAIVTLTWKAAFRYRLFWVMLGLLLLAVVGLPVLLKDDGTARGFAQIVITYTLSSVTALLGMATLWLACGTLARDIEECQIQMIAVKPIPLWQVWLGKWIGLLTLNAVLLAIAGACIAGLIQWRAKHLPPEEQETLRREVLVARGSLKEPPVDFRPIVEREFQRALKEKDIPPADRPFVRQQIEERVKAYYQLVPPGIVRQWIIPAGHVRNLNENEPLHVRVKFYVVRTNESGTYIVAWRFGRPTGPRRVPDIIKSMAAESVVEFTIPAAAIEEDGRLIINCTHAEDNVLLFPLEDGLEVLYREGGFGLNFARGLGVILCWLGLMAAIGLAASSFLSFPVAAFFSLTMLILVFSSGSMAASVEEGTIMGVDHETNAPSNPVIDAVMLPVFKGMLAVVNLARSFSPVESLSTGRSIPWETLGLAFVQVVLLLGGVFAAVGMIVLSRRELATAQGTS